MPTVVGDIVIAHSRTMRIAYTVWRVTEDGEQVPGPSAATSTAMGREPAMSLARKMSAEHGGGGIYVLNLDSRAWTKLSD